MKNAWQRKSIVFLSPRMCQFYFKEEISLCNYENAVDIKIFVHNLLENIINCLKNKLNKEEYGPKMLCTDIWNYTSYKNLCRQLNLAWYIMNNTVKIWWAVITHPELQLFTFYLTVMVLFYPCHRRGNWNTRGK